MLQKVQLLGLGPIASDKLVTLVMCFLRVMMAAYLCARLLFGGNKDKNLLLYI